MAQDTLKKIAEYKTRLADLERELHAELAELPARYGFATPEEFIAAFRRSVGKQGGRKAGKAKSAELKTKTGRKPRAKVTPEIVEQVKALVAEGKTGSEIAKVAGISLPTVQNIKKKLGLVAKS